MRIETETYAVVSFEELKLAHDMRDKCILDFNCKYRNYLLTCLCNAGFSNVKVRAKKENITGFIEVTLNNGSSYYPYKLRFYPVKKNGEKSLKHTYIAGLLPFYGEDLTEKLLSLFELAGEDNAS